MRVGAAVGDDPVTDAEDDTVAARCELDLVDLLAGMNGGEEVFAAILDPCSTSPPRISAAPMTLSPQSSWRIGASGSSPRKASTTTGSSSKSTAIKSRASSAT
jgi:hypothetical protein